MAQRNSAVASQHVAESGKLAAQSVAALASDPELSAVLSMRALQVRYTPQAEDALRQAAGRLQLLRTFRAGSPARLVAVSPDGGQVIAGTESGAMPIWNTATGRRLAVLREPAAGGLGSANFSIAGNSVTSVSYSPDGTRIVTASDDTTARIWAAATGRQLRTFGASNTLNDAAFSPDGTRVVTASEDGRIVIWNAASGQRTWTLREPGGRTRAGRRLQSWRHRGPDRQHGWHRQDLERANCPAGPRAGHAIGL